MFFMDNVFLYLVAILKMMCYWFLIEVCWCGCGDFVVVVIMMVMVVVMAVVVVVGMRKCFPAWKMHNKLF